jgi:hypothetical protein
MECLLVTAFLIFVIAIPFARMLFRRNSPNHWRKLLRLDLAALIVIVTGVAGALAIVRGADLVSAICVLTIVLPMSLAFAWLARYVIEDFAARGARRTNRGETDMSFLNGAEKPAEEVVPAELANGERQGQP